MMEDYTAFRVKGILLSFLTTDHQGMGFAQLRDDRLTVIRYVLQFHLISVEWRS